jgi:hypothetical protein
MFNKHCKDEHQIRYLKSLYLQAVGSSVQETFYEHPSLNRAFEERAATGNFKPRKRQILRRGDTPGPPHFVITYSIYVVPTHQSGDFGLEKILGGSGLYLHNTSSIWRYKNVLFMDVGAVGNATGECLCYGYLLKN